MNNKNFIAKITWLSKEQGGRKGVIPIGFKTYAPQIAIGGNKIFNGSIWSLLCFSFELIEDNKTKAFIRFLNTKQLTYNESNFKFVDSYVKKCNNATF